VKEAKEFCYKYDAYVQDSGRMHRRSKRIDYKMWSESDPEMFFQSIPYEEVRCVEIHMPEDRFRALLEHDDWVEKAGLQDNRHFANNVSRVSQMVVDHDRECRIRNANPSVQIAYEKYQTLLRLVDSHYD
jgi:hypothetical protein